MLIDTTRTNSYDRTEALLFCSRHVLGSNLDHETGNPDKFLLSFSVPIGKLWMSSLIRPRPPPSTTFKLIIH